VSTVVRRGGDLVVETLAALGATTVFGEPGQHALGLFDALSRSDLRYVGFRTELDAGFAADGWSRTTGQPAPLFLSTGPGALQSLAALQEAAAASIPVVAIVSQIPTAGLGGRRRGFLHELRDQRSVAAGVVKHAIQVQHASQISSAIREAWEVAQSPAPGPVWVEVPQDLLLAETTLPPVTSATAAPARLAPQPELVAEAVRLLDGATRPVILAGGGVLRAGADAELLSLAEALRAPVVTSFGAKGAFPWTHPLSLQSWLEDWHVTELLQDADVLLVVGSGLGELTSQYHSFRPGGRVIQVDADRGKLEANHAGLGIHADARLALAALADGVAERPVDGEAEKVVADVLARVEARLAGQDLSFEQQVLASVRAALPDDAPSFWDMTILGYWAWSAWDARRPGSTHSAQGAGGLGYGFPAALGAAVAGVGPVLAVSGDGGALYGLGDLATAAQHQLDVTWLIVDDGGYGILREYMTGTFGAPFGTELARPDYIALAAAFGVPGVRTSAESLQADLAEALATPGPSVVVLPALLRMFEPTHLHALAEA
jgi:acetolactate synthase-1/2/3 large subunit